MRVAYHPEGTPILVLEALKSDESSASSFLFPSVLALVET